MKTLLSHNETGEKIFVIDSLEDYREYHLLYHKSNNLTEAEENALKSSYYGDKKEDMKGLGEDNKFLCIACENGKPLVGITELIHVNDLLENWNYQMV